MEREDRNGDGKVSEDEFRGRVEYFVLLDTNNDGHISADEAPTRPPRR